MVVMVVVVVGSGGLGRVTPGGLAGRCGQVLQSAAKFTGAVP